MRRNGLLKALSIVLAFCICVSTMVFGTVAQDNDANEQQTAITNSVEETVLNKYMPPDLSSGFPAYCWTGLTGSDKTAAAPRFAKDEGVDGSNGFRFGSKDVAKKYYQDFGLRFSKTGALEADTEYHVSVKLKKDFGEITSVKLGMLDDNGSGAGKNFMLTLNDSDITEDWKTFEWDYTPTATVLGKWSCVVFKMETDTGASIVIDDIVVYKKADTQETNLFEKGSFDGNVRYGIYNNSVTETREYIPVVVPSANEFPYIYWHNLSSQNAELAKVRLAENEGVNGTHGVRIGATGFAITSYQTTFKFPKTSALKADTKYIVSLKLKKDAGEITSLKLGILDNGSNASANFACQLTSEYFTDEWTMFEWEYTPTYNVSGQWSSIAFDLKTGTNGGSVLIDDIIVYEADDAKKKNIFTKGNFEYFVKQSVYTETTGETTGYIPVTVPAQNEFPYIYWTNLTGANKDAAQVRIAKGEGIDGTNGIRIGATGFAITSYQTTFKFPRTSALEADTKYIVSVKLKKDAGEVTNLKLGMLDNGTNASIDYACELTGEYITDNWTMFEWEYTPTYTVQGQWSSVAFDLKTGADGGSILLDDIIVYKADDAEKKNIFTKGSFDTAVKMNTVYETVTEPSEYLPLDLSGGAIHIYWHSWEEGSAEIEAARPRAVAGVGFNKTAAMCIGAEGIAINYYEASIKFPVLSSLKADTEYIVKFKVKKDMGEVTNLKVGMFDNGTDALAIHSCELTSEYISDEWTEFEWKYTPTYEVDKQWSSVTFNLKTAQAGGSVLIDDIIVYEASDETKTNLFTYGSFDSDCKSYPVIENETNEAVVPIEIYDYTDKKSSDKSTALPRYYWNEGDFRNEMRPISVKEGVNGTYALQIGGLNGPINYYGIGMYFTNRGTWKNNTEYIVSVKLKKKQGSITSFKMGYNDPTAHNVVALSDEYLSNEWTEFVWSFTTSDIANNPSSDNVISFELKALEEGAVILIDDLKVYRADDKDKKDIFYRGSFEYVDGGQEPVNWNTTPSGTVEPVLKTDYNKDYNGNDVVARVVNCDTPSGDYCLAFGFDKEKSTNNELYITLQSTRSGGTYKIGFWVKVVGEVYNAQIGMVEGDYSFESCGSGYMFNQYEHGKWTYCEFEVSDTGTFMTNKSYRRFCVRFNAPAGSGMLIDGVTVTDANHPDPLDYMYFGDFEKTTIIPEVDWKSDDRFIYKEEK